jgi:hypothetical protein
MLLLRFVTPLLILGACSGGLLSVACNRVRLPRPPSAPSEARLTEESKVFVTHPPPAALPEIVPDPPSQQAEWLAGSWVWRANSWVWDRGGWISNADRLRLVETQVHYTQDGTIEFCPRQWLDANGHPVEAPAVVRPAATPPTPALPESQTIP